MIVLDTNVLSELLRPRPAERVEAWIQGQPALTLYTTTITQAEMLLGVAILSAGKRKKELADAVAGLFDQDLAGRVLPFDSRAAQTFANVVATRRRAGRPVAQLDAQIAAIARSQGATLATRNTADFDGCEVELVNPWAE